MQLLTSQEIGALRPAIEVTCRRQFSQQMKTENRDRPWLMGHWLFRRSYERSACQPSSILVRTSLFFIISVFYRLKPLWYIKSLPKIPKPITAGVFMRVNANVYTVVVIRIYARVARWQIRVPVSYRLVFTIFLLIVHSS